jgi:hypothetical protein
MATVTLSIPDGLINQVVARLGSKGRDDFEEFVLCLLQSFAMEGTPIDAETERKLIEGLESPSSEMTEADWDALRNRIGRKSMK